ncbi:siroheme synthase CysG [[Pseudomonas] carboxydohydrogena]|uniref:Siroheme synthase CysG n=1 Tax=Afipia carboxydohydrogena TaxID=290 RepID=A0ABY8BQ79_AFICR|nr:siroheme synthase CysG [[Pseudomonas] carboxydohydrogena]WEF52149.1 siroheme synthase CysG [[Pseudomonas] carboxydohydrogena]
MRFLPIFLDLQAGPVLLVGAGDLVRAKLRLLLSAGARVRWFAVDGDYESGLDSEAAGRVERAGDPLSADLNGVIAILCAGAGELGETVAARARAAGIPVNVMDDLAHSTFIFPAIVDRGDVVVAVGTGGSSPVVARRVREKIESILPARIGDLAAFIGRWRKPMQARLPEMSARRTFWERIVDGPIGALILSGRESEAEQALRAIENPEAFASERGLVTLVGAGPGDPDLLTIKALRALQDADVIFYDDLVSSEVLDRARRDAARVSVGRRIGKPGIGQDATNALMIAAAREGKRAVRLKGGDSFVFGRGGEEIAALREAGVAYAVIPGVTAGIGAAAQFEVPLTFRKKATRITFLTAHKTHDAEAVDWSLLTDVAMTVVVYMGITAAPAIRAGMLAAGRSPDTPVGVFARVTRPDAKAVVGTLDQLPDLVTQVENGPAILIIGDVVERSLLWRGSDLGRLAASLMEKIQ